MLFWYHTTNSSVFTMKNRKMTTARKNQNYCSNIKFNFLDKLLKLLTVCINPRIVPGYYAYCNRIVIWKKVICDKNRMLQETLGIV